VSGDPPGYYAYLIRLWRTGLDGPWRASLEDARTGERIGFSGLSEAFAYLLSKTQRATEADSIDAPRQDRGEDEALEAPASTGRCG
jgi:hypothetical protein